MVKIQSTSLQNKTPQTRSVKRSVPQRSCLKKRSSLIGRTGLSDIWSRKDIRSLLNLMWLKKENSLSNDTIARKFISEKTGICSHLINDSDVFKAGFVSLNYVCLCINLVANNIEKIIEKVKRKKRVTWKEKLEDIKIIPNEVKKLKVRKKHYLHFVPL